MKRVFTLLALCLVTAFAMAQTPFSMISTHDNGSETSALSANSLNNPWVGSSLKYNVSGDVSKSFVLGARAMYVVAKGERWSIPFLANVGLNNPDSLSADAGVTLGAYPWYNLSGDGNLALLLHGGLSYQILDRSNAEGGNQFRIMGGLEAVLYPQDGTGAPTTLSVAPEFVTSTAELVTSSYWGLNLTSVVPIANGLGLLLEGSVPLESGTRSTGFSIGLIVAAPIN